MGLIYRRRQRVRGGWLNWSTRGLSGSARLGRRVTVNTRGRGIVRLARGLSFRFKL